MLKLYVTFTILLIFSNMREGTVPRGKIGRIWAKIARVRLALSQRHAHTAADRLHGHPGAHAHPAPNLGQRYHKASVCVHLNFGNL